MACDSKWGGNGQNKISLTDIQPYSTVDDPTKIIKVNAMEFTQAASLELT